MLVKAVPQCSRGGAESKRIRVLLDGVWLGLCQLMAGARRKPRERVVPGSSLATIAHARLLIRL